MRLFIVGNGFDIEHNLPTKYWDFRKFLASSHTKFLGEFEAHYQIYPGMSNETKKSLLWNNFESNLANIDEDIEVEMAVGIELDLESGDIGIEDTLYKYFSDEYQYIRHLAEYLKEWVRTIRIRDCCPKTSVIDKRNNDLYLNFNYTAVLETVYGILPENVIHIHGSLRKYTADPVIGHGNQSRIQRIHEKVLAAEFEEKKSSIYRVIEDYYKRTLKDINKYAPLLARIRECQIDEIIVIGHSLNGIDMPYFTFIDSYTNKKANWIIYCHNMDEVPTKRKNLESAGISISRIVTKNAREFFDL